jgi:hypothetical protein
MPLDEFVVDGAGPNVGTSFPVPSGGRYALEILVAATLSDPSGSSACAWRLEALVEDGKVSDGRTLQVGADEETVTCALSMDAGGASVGFSVAEWASIVHWAIRARWVRVGV